MGCLLIITGASGSGKTTLLNYLKDEQKCKTALKYSERESRGIDDDIISVKNIDSVKLGCDIIYEINNVKYGLNTSEIVKQMSENSIVVIILSEITQVRKLKEIIGFNAVSVYISSTIDKNSLKRIQTQRYKFEPTKDEIDKLYEKFNNLKCATNLKLWNRVAREMHDLEEIWESALPERRSYEIRINRIRKLHNRYIDNIDLFDFVILNHYSLEDMYTQACNIISSLEPRHKDKKKPVIFVVFAASGAGKGTLMENLNIMGVDEIKIVSKVAKRNSKSNDKRDGMKAIGIDGKIPIEYDWRWIFHKHNSGFSGVEYAVSKMEICDNLKQNRPQIFISNFGQIDNAREFFGDNVVFVYLHAARSINDIETYQHSNCDTVEEAEMRISEIRKVYEDYIENIGLVDHVLLNTTYKEDMYEQMLKLIHHYK